MIEVTDRSSTDFPCERRQIEIKTNSSCLVLNKIIYLYEGRLIICMRTKEKIEKFVCTMKFVSKCHLVIYILSITSWKNI